MHEKRKSHISEEDQAVATKNDIDDALYLAIVSRNLECTKATLSRITRIDYEEGDRVHQFFLDYGSARQEVLVNVDLVKAMDEEVEVKRFHVSYVKGDGSVPFLATA